MRPRHFFAIAVALGAWASGCIERPYGMTACPPGAVCGPTAEPPPPHVVVVHRRHRHRHRVVAVVPGGAPAGASAQTTATDGAADRDDDDPVQATATASAPEAPPPAAAAPAPAKATAANAKPAKREEPNFDEYGPRWTEAQMDEVLAYEYNKDSWDNGSIRKSQGETYYGTITVAYKCDQRDGCPDKNSGWKPVAWMIPK